MPEHSPLPQVFFFNSHSLGYMTPSEPQTGSSELPCWQILGHDKSRAPVVSAKQQNEVD